MPFHTLTPLENLAVAYVHAAQRSFAPCGPVSATAANGAHELSIAVDQTGASHIDRQIFGPHGGHISPAVMTAIGTPTVGCRIIHNHPAQGSLSASDWRLMAAQHPGLDEMIAVNSRGSQFRGKVVSKHLSVFMAAIPTPSEPSMIVEGNTSAPYYSCYSNQLGANPNLVSPKGLFDHIGWMFSHIVNLRFAHLGWVEYRADLAPDDLSDFNDTTFQPIVRSATNEATAMFP